MEYALDGHGYSRARVYLAHILSKRQGAERGAWMGRRLDRLLRTLDAVPAQREPPPGGPPSLLATLRSRSPAGPIDGRALVVATAVKAVFDDLHTQGNELCVAQCSIETSELHREHMLIGAYFPALTADVQPNDSVAAGAMISLRGGPAEECHLEVFPRIYRKICTNGTVQFSEHAAARELPSELLWRSDPQGPLVAAIAQAIRDCLAPGAFEEAVQNFRRSASEELRPADVAFFLRHLTDLAVGALPREVASTILRRFLDQRDLTRWGLLNAMTAEARVAPSALQLTLERLGGTLPMVSARGARNLLPSRLVAPDASIIPSSTRPTHKILGEVA